MKIRGRLLSVLLLLLIVASSFGVMATEEPAIIKDTIVVTEDGGRFQVGFVNIDFKKDFLDKEELPKTYEVEIYAENGVPYIDISPDTDKFNKKVHIRVDRYTGLIYDKIEKRNIKVDIKKNNIVVHHFSRYCLIR